MLKRKQIHHEDSGYKGNWYLAPVLLTFVVDFFLFSYLVESQKKTRKYLLKEGMRTTFLTRAS